MVPSASLLIARTELQNYWTRRNPALTHATKLYKESTLSHPDIPKSVFTKNIDTILSKKFKKQTDAPMDDSSTALSPLSSLTGGATGTTASAKGSIAWRRPLQDTLLSKEKVKGKAPESSTEINQRKQIVILEAQLALRSGNSSVDSETSKVSKSSSKSEKSKASRSSSQSGLTAASAHSRVDRLESSLKEIKDLIKSLTISHPAPSASAAAIVPLHEDPLWAKSASDTLPAGHGMKGVELFPAESQGCTILARLESPTKAKQTKRSKPSSPTKSPPTSNLRLQYNEHSGSSGGAPC